MLAGSTPARCLLKASSDSSLLATLNQLLQIPGFEHMMQKNEVELRLIGSANHLFITTMYSSNTSPGAETSAGCEVLYFEIRLGAVNASPAA